MWGGNVHLVDTRQHGVRRERWPQLLRAHTRLPDWHSACTTSLQQSVTGRPCPDCCCATAIKVHMSLPKDEFIDCLLSDVLAQDSAGDLHKQRLIMQRAPTSWE